MRIGQWTFSTPRNEGDRQDGLNREGYDMNRGSEPGGLALVVTKDWGEEIPPCLLYTSPSPRDS